MADARSTLVRPRRGTDAEVDPPGGRLQRCHTGRVRGTGAESGPHHSAPTHGRSVAAARMGGAEAVRITGAAAYPVRPLPLRQHLFVERFLGLCGPAYVEVRDEDGHAQRRVANDLTDVLRQGIVAQVVRK